MIKKSQTGFTLVELLIVMGIVSILTGILFLNYGSTEERLKLERAAQKLAQDIRRTQEFALVAKKQDCGGGTATSTYLIKFEKGEKDYQILAVCPSELLEVANTTLEKKVYIKSLETNEGDSNPLTITFAPPDPIVIINNDENFKEAKIILSLENSTLELEKTIETNKAGRIKVGRIIVK